MNKYIKNLFRVEDSLEYFFDRLQKMNDIQYPHKFENYILEVRKLRELLYDLDTDEEIKPDTVEKRIESLEWHLNYAYKQIRELQSQIANGIKPTPNAINNVTKLS